MQTGSGEWSRPGKGLKAMDKLEKMFADIRQEIEDTRQIFPGNHHKMAVLSEEVGELAQALLQNEYDGQPVINVYREAVQVAAMAIRLAIEGDHSFKYRYPADKALPGAGDVRGILALSEEEKQNLRDGKWQG